MPGAYLSFEGTALQFDVVLNEQTEHTATATEHPVEKGANVSDHVRDQLDKVTLEVMVSNTPITDVNSLYGGGFDTVNLADGATLGNSKLVPDAKIPLTPGQLFSAVGDAVASLFSDDAPKRAVVVKWPTKFNAVKDTMDTLIDWKKRGVVGKVITPWHTFDSMIIEHVAPLRNADMGDAARIAIELKEIRTVETSLINAPKPLEIRAKPAVQKGAQNPTPEDPTKSSVAVKVGQALGVLD